MSEPIDHTEQRALATLASIIGGIGPNGERVGTGDKVEAGEKYLKLKADIESRSLLRRDKALAEKTQSDSHSVELTRVQIEAARLQMEAQNENMRLQIEMERLEVTKAEVIVRALEVAAGRPGELGRVVEMLSDRLLGTTRTLPALEDRISQEEK